MKKIMECVPNFSEGRNMEVMEAILEPFKHTEGMTLLDWSHDEDHNRMVVTLVGEPEALKTSVIEAVKIAVKKIDLNHHTGQHPRMGAVDVIPFVPVKGVTQEEAIELSKEVGKIIGEEIGIPVFLYEDSATTPERQNLAKIRKGQFEGMKEKIHEPEWHPDFGPSDIHPTAGVVAVGARMFLVAYNVNLDDPNVDHATAIAKRVRHIGGGLHFCKGMGVDLTERHQSQVSMNLTNYKKTAIYRAHEMVRMEAKRYGAKIVGSEIIGMIPEEALRETLAYYLHKEEIAEGEMDLEEMAKQAVDFLQVENFQMDQVLEYKLAKQQGK
ncbi:glutamate formimidoyltransferase [Porphyromonas sp. HMSC065F10]|uniref:glutamate formimidoyltransferase n=1 Tax=Porphyromonas sp. HMSC065F10 TaxID=1739394 RepID=UPI0008A62F8E|nr:glutamate formimidoyltransferase [Porphyromonas sp. HMSC065F10]OFR41099.1 glutamate formiminotransferase [Porphyromonas sp. HMSC065F10]